MRTLRRAGSGSLPDFAALAPSLRRGRNVELHEGVGGRPHRGGALARNLRLDARQACAERRRNRVCCEDRICRGRRGKTAAGRAAHRPGRVACRQSERISERRIVEPLLVAKRVPLADIEPGTPVFEGQLSSEFADRVEPGERAVAVRVDEAGAVGDRVRPGNVVDVFLTLKRDGAGIGGHGEIARSQAKLLLSRVRVLAFGDALPAGGGPNAHDVHARTVVLAVPTEEVDRLALADSAGHLLLALRNPHDIDGGQRSSSALLARVGGSATRAVRPSTVADAGVSLGALSGSDGGVEATPEVRPPTMRRATSGAERVEVVRAGHVDSPGS
ncbi:Flp pilus assembly protein CpaB [Paraburkholderia sp. NMBU_R16]|uniref:Flp pilus assembly protein CpaB n=1 Tax=Paraburkholderia sp. NMBU_R16 TaxID=2698676 RepID=UPI0020B69AF1|nr:Flp pilus assembly protein CpaB [Paraburkholderia sp. NMBU_R16]